MNIFDYNKIYYKVTNKEEKHHGYQYKDGLNILEEEFNDNPNASCVSGGFYFTDYEHLPRFLNHGVWIREVRIPKGAKVIKDLDGNKWRTDKIIFRKKYHINNDFDKWFNPNKFSWKYSGHLAHHCSKHFDRWFNPDKFDWKSSSWALAEYCFNYFDKWFNPEKFNWNSSWALAKHCSDKFNKWFNPEKFDWSYSNYLAQYCFNHFDKWFDPEKFDWRNSEYLAKYCSNHFNKWFDSEKFDWYYGSWALVKYCFEYKDKWFDPNKFNWECSRCLIKHCPEH